MSGQRLRPAAAVALLCLSLAGCGGGPGGAGGAGGVPGGGGGNQGGHVAKGSPLTIPDVTQSQGAPLADVLKSIELGTALPTEPGHTYTGLIDQCGGTLCVTIQIKRQAHPGLLPCVFISSDPAPNAKIYRGQVLTVYATPGSCSAGSSSPSP
jgi:hypothetical protein